MPGESHETTDISDQRPKTRDTDQEKQQMSRQQQITQRSKTRQQQNVYINYLHVKYYEITETRDLRPVTKNQRQETMINSKCQDNSKLLSAPQRDNSKRLNKIICLVNHTREQRPETRDQRSKTREHRPETRDQRPETRDFSKCQDNSKLLCNPQRDNSKKLI